MSTRLAIACTRASTLAKVLVDGFGLRAYEAATTLQTVAAHPDLRTSLALVDPTCQGSWRLFKPLHEEAQRRRGKPEAQAGTNIHSIVEHLVSGVPVAGLVPDEVLRDAEAVVAALTERGLTPVASEEFVFIPNLREPVAGTRDLLVRSEAGALQVVDVKTTERLGSHQYRGMEWATQLALYAHGVPYPHEVRRDRWERPLLDPELLEACEDDREVDVAIGLVIEVERGTGRAAVHGLNLRYGWAMAALACRVRAARKVDCFG